MRSFILAILIALGTAACQTLDRNFIKSQELAKGIEKEKLANTISRKAALKIKQETDMHPCGSMGQMLREVQKLGLAFQHYKPIDIAEGRKLLIQAINTMMEEVNQEKRIHPYLIRCPFIPRNIEIEIFLYNPDRGNVPEGALSVIDAQDGVLRYKIDDPNPETPGFIRVYQETYDQAVERLKDPSLPLVPFQPDVKKISPEELARLRKGISMVGDDGSIWHLDKDGRWIKDPRT